MKRIKNLRLIITVCIITILCCYLTLKFSEAADTRSLWTAIILASSLLSWAIIFIIVDGVMLLARHTIAQTNLLAYIAKERGIDIIANKIMDEVIANAEFVNENNATDEEVLKEFDN